MPMSSRADRLNRLGGPSSLVLAALLASTPAIAQGQTAAADTQAGQRAPAGATPSATGATADSDAQEVVVQGYRAALASAIASKRMSNNIVDVIKADDMASFPDANLAESIQRIPGVSIQRDAGEGRNVTVRGLGGDFVRTLLNGIEAYSATTGSTWPWGSRTCWTRDTDRRSSRPPAGCAPSTAWRWSSSRGTTGSPSAARSIAARSLPKSVFGAGGGLRFWSGRCRWRGRCGSI